VMSLSDNTNVAAREPAMMAPASKLSDDPSSKWTRLLNGAMNLVWLVEIEWIRWRLF